MPRGRPRKAVSESDISEAEKLRAEVNGENATPEVESGKVSDPPVKRPRVDAEAEGRDVAEMLSVLFRIVTGEDLSTKQVEFDRRTVEGYSEKYKVKPSLWLLHARAVIGGAWYAWDLIGGALRRWKASKNERARADNRSNGIRENVAGTGRTPCDSGSSDTHSVP